MISIQSCSFCRERSAHASFTVNVNQSDAQSVSWLVLLSILVSNVRWTKLMKKQLYFWGQSISESLKNWNTSSQKLKCFSSKTKFASDSEHEPKALVSTMRLFNRRLSLGTDVPLSSNQQSLNHYSRWVQTFNALSCTWFPAERFPAAYAARDAPLNLPEN